MDQDFQALMAAEKAGKPDLTPEEARDKITRWVQAQHWFAGKMLDKMLQNGHKAGWKGMSMDYLRQRIDAEREELENAMGFRPLHEWNATDSHNKQMREIIDECADIANFAMMLADNARDMVR